MNCSFQWSWLRSKLPGPCLIRVRSLVGRAMSGNRPPEALLNHRAKHCSSGGPVAEALRAVAYAEGQRLRLLAGNVEKP